MWAPDSVSDVFYYCTLLICRSAEVCVQCEQNSEVQVSLSYRKKPFGDKIMLISDGTFIVLSSNMSQFSQMDGKCQIQSKQGGKGTQAMFVLHS